MGFQSSVNRQFTAGFPGEIVRNGPTRAKPARIASVTLGVDPGASTNRISRAFGWSADLAPVGAMEGSVVVGGAAFFGILGNSKHNALQGTTAGGSLAPSLDLPQYAEGEFFDMATGIVVELFNETTGVKTVNFGDQVAFCPNTISGANNPLALPYGALIAVPAGSAAPTGFTLIPNARIQNPVSMTASALGTLVATYTIIQLTQ